MLRKRLAVGGMAELYLGDDTTTGQPVVIKRILPYLSDEADFLQMFLDEARIASQLNHENIVQLYELGQKKGSIFIAMEYVDGADLRQLFQEEQRSGGVVPYSIAAWVISEVCKGLHYAHVSVGLDGQPLGIIHRDVSPQNVVLGRQGQVKLVDFGIAKATAMMERSKPGVIKGKFLYLSPEQIAQENIDLRSDLFALGSMLYEITTGTPPFARATSEAVLYAIRLEEPKPPESVRLGYPKMLSDIVMKCLKKNRDERYSDALEIQEDLRQFLETFSARLSHEGVGHYVSEILARRQKFREAHGSTSQTSYPSNIPDESVPPASKDKESATPGSAYPTAHIRPPPPTHRDEPPTSHVVVPAWDADSSIPISFSESSVSSNVSSKRWAWFFVGLCLMGGVATASWPLKPIPAAPALISPVDENEYPLSSKLQTEPSLSAIVFQAPLGSRIQSADTQEWFAPSVRYFLKAGAYRLTVRCRGRKKSFERIVDVGSKTNVPQYVRLCEGG